MRRRPPDSSQRFTHRRRPSRFRRGLRAVGRLFAGAAGYVLAGARRALSAAVSFLGGVAGVRRIVIVHDRLSEDDAAAWVGLAGHPLVATVVNSGGVTLYELDATAPATASGWAYLDGRVRTQVAAAGTRVSVPLEIGNPGPGPWVPAGDAGRRQLSLGFEDANEIAVTASAQTFLPPPFMRSGATFELSVSFSVPSKPGCYVLIGRIDGEIFLSQNLLMERVAGGGPGDWQSGASAEVVFSARR